MKNVLDMLYLEYGIWMYLMYHTPTLCMSHAAVSFNTSSQAYPSDVLNFAYCLKSSVFIA